MRTIWKKKLRPRRGHPYMRKVMLLLLLAGLSPADAADWPMLLGSRTRNNVSDSSNIPDSWDVKTGKNIKWAAELGSQSHGNTIVAQGQVYVGTNNVRGYDLQYPSTVDRGCLVCFRESDGDFLWQFSRAKLPTGRVHDWPYQGICSAPLVERDRMWFVSNRCEIICLDTHGFYDGEDEGEVEPEWDNVFELASNLSLETQTTDQSTIEEHRKLIDLTVQAIVKSELEDRRYGPYAIRANAEFGRWRVQPRPQQNKQPSPQSSYEIVLTDSELQIRSAADDSKILTKYSTNLVDGLDQGVMGAALRNALRAIIPGFPSKLSIESIEPGRSWNVRAVVRKQPAQFHLLQNGNSLSCRLKRGFGASDLVWSFDMMGELGVSPHNMATCSPASWGDVLFVCTSNGVDESHLKLPAPDAPSFIAIDKRSGKLLWTDNSPGKNILHGQWSCPAIGVFDGVPQVIFPGGDGWIYSFHAEQYKDGKPTLLWKFDGNAKESKWIVSGTGTRNNAIAVPVIADGKVYITMGQDPEHGGDGVGNLWCIDPTKRGDISAELAIDEDGNDLLHRRIQAVNRSLGERSVPNPNSGVIWNFREFDSNKDGEIDFEEQMHRSIASPVIKDGLLYIGDFAGIFYCIDANTGRPLWSYDCFSPCWGTALVVDGKVFVGDEDGDVCVFEHGPRKNLLNEIYMEDSIKMTPIAVNDVLYIGTLKTLYAIRQDSDTAQKVTR